MFYANDPSDRFLDFITLHQLVVCKFAPRVDHSEVIFFKKNF